MNIYKNYFKKPDTIYFLLLLFFVFLIRAPYFFIDNIDGDEAGFIIKALAITKGKIPYLDFHNLKPPITPYLISIPMVILGENIFVVRLFAAFLVFLSSILVYKISNTILNNKESFFASSFFAIGVSFICRSFKSQSFYSEHFSIFLILLSIFIFTKYQQSNKIFFNLVIGVLLGLCVLNTPYLLFYAIFFSIFPFILKKELKKRIVSSILIGTGGFLIFFLFIFYFYQFFPSILNYIIEVPLSLFSDEGGHDYSFSRTAYLLIGSGLQLSSYKFFGSFIIWFFGFIGIIKYYLINQDRNKLLIILSIIVLLFSIWNIRYPSGRYLIILIPFFCIFSVYFISNLSFKNSIITNFIKVFLLLVIFLIPSIDIKNQIDKLSQNNLNKNTRTIGACTSIYNTIKKNIDPKNQVYLQHCEIIYLFLDQLPLVNYYYSSIIYNKKLSEAFGIFNSGDAIFKQDPKLLVISTPLEVFMNSLNFINYKQGEISKKYSLINKSKNTYIYVKK